MLQVNRIVSPQSYKFTNCHSRNSSGSAGADLDDEIIEVACDRVWEGAMSPETVIPYAPKQKSITSETDIVDRAGNAILDFVKHAEEATETEFQELREAAEYLADQLRAANQQINDLESDVRRHQARADRAEEWLRQISSEIEHSSARRLSFLRMSGRSEIISNQPQQNLPLAKARR